MARITHIDDLDKIAVAGVNWRPIRRTLGITAFGINAYTADTGEQLIEEHDEVGPGGAAGHEEVYLVTTGHATFTIDGAEHDAPKGTLVFLDDPAQKRSAIAIADGTTAIAVGGAAGTITPSPWEHSFAAAPLVAAGDYRGAYDLAARGLADHPDHPTLHYNLACYSALAGDTDRALEHLRKAIDVQPRAREWAAADSDFDSIRDDPRFVALS